MYGKRRLILTYGSIQARTGNLIRKVHHLKIESSKSTNHVTNSAVIKTCTFLPWLRWKLFVVLFSFCSLPDEPEERHPMNQSILYNHGQYPLSVRSFWKVSLSNWMHEYNALSLSLYLLVGILATVFDILSQEIDVRMMVRKNTMVVFLNEITCDVVK